MTLSRTATTASIGDLGLRHRGDDVDHVGLAVGHGARLRVGFVARLDDGADAHP